MKRGRGSALALAAAVLAAAWPVGALHAQETRERDCRCVDEAGREIERCVCVVTPNVDRIVRGRLFGGADRPRLGLSVDVGDTEARGARVTDVLEDGPAEEAGLRAGDVITRLDGRSLLEPIGPEREEELDLDGSLPAQRLLALARELEPGDEVDVEYLRDGETRTATVQAEDLADRMREFAWAGPRWNSEAFEEEMRALSERMRELRGPGAMRAPRAPRAPGAPGTPRAPDAPRGEGLFRFRLDEPGAAGMGMFRFGGARAGVELVELNPELGSYFGVEGGVLVANVEEDSELGLRPGDVILDIGGRAVDTPRRFYEILATYDEDEGVVFRVRREGREISVSGRVTG